MSQPVVPLMPAHGDHRAPQFDPAKPCELPHFFEELKFQFVQSHVVDEEEMKKHALQFVHCDTVELWEILPEFIDAAVPYQKFVDAVYKLYPGSDMESHWLIADMDKLVGKASRVGISSLTDLGKCHREFIAITTFLIVKKCISAVAQSCTFACGFPQKLWSKVTHRLQLKFPDHFPDDPYTLEQIHDTMQFVLHSTVSFSLALDDMCTPALTTISIARAKPTELTTLTDIMKQAITKLGTQSAPAPQVKPLAAALCNLHCHFCRGEDWKSSCKVLKEYVQDGKCMLCNNGHITLPGGHFIPRAITSKTFKECLDEWHCQNPASTSMTNALMLGISPTVGILQLSPEECIQSLEKELFALHTHELAPGVQMWAQKAHNPNPATDAQIAPK